jgi:hypothetical protein
MHEVVSRRRRLNLMCGLAGLGCRNHGAARGIIEGMLKNVQDVLDRLEAGNSTPW